VTKVPTGPWVVVVGMHRSGTSALTGTLTALGLNPVHPDDRMERSESNPEHWESLSLSLLNEELLHRLGGSWDAPPDLPRHWVHSASVFVGDEPRATMAEAYPEEGPSVWKDPRLCLLLPYWRTHLSDPMTAVFVWRNPLAVAHSLHVRDGLPIVVGLALWERYNRTALENLVGIDTLGVEFDDAVADPTGFVDRCAEWLGGLDRFSGIEGRWDLGQAAAAIASDLKHQPDRFSAEEEALITTEQRELLACLERTSGTHCPHREGPPPLESAWTTALIDTRRALTRQDRMAEVAHQAFWSTRARLASLFVELRTVERDLLNERQGHGDSLRALDDLRRARDILLRRLEQAQLAMDQAQLDLDEAGRKLLNVHESTSWKVTSPLRSAIARVEGKGRHPGRS
jgi:hypothetical protein